MNKKKYTIKNKSKRYKYNNNKGKSRKGGLGTFFPAPPKNKDDMLKTLTTDIGRVKLQRVEQSLQQEFDKLKELRQNCASGCKIDSCLFNNKGCENKDAFQMQNDGIVVANKCVKKFNNLNCKNYISLHNKIVFYLKYINDVNDKCHSLMDLYKTSIVNKNTLLI